MHDLKRMQGCNLEVQRWGQEGQDVDQTELGKGFEKQREKKKGILQVYWPEETGQGQAL